MIKYILPAITAAIFMTVSAYAAPAMPNIGDALKQVAPPREVIPEKQPVPEIKQYEKPALKSIDTKTVYVKSFKITGNSAIKTEILSEIANKAENIGRDMTLKDIQAVASQITRYYRAHGYFVARAYIPVQSMVDGIVEITVLEGSYGKFQLHNSSHVKDRIIKGMLDDVKDSNIISTNTIERAMLIINDTPGARVTQADVTPGEEIGTSDFIITASGTSRINGYIMADNAGSRYTGTSRLMAGAWLNSPFGLGDRLFVSGLVSSGSDLTNGRIAYSLPLTYSGMRGELAYSRTNYSLTEEYDALDAEGNSDNIEMNFSYPVIRTRLENLKVTVNFISRDMEDKINSLGSDIRKDSKSAEAGLIYSRQNALLGVYCKTELSGTLTYGKLSFDSAEDERRDKAGADTEGTYSKIKLNLANSFIFSPKWTFKAALTAQSSLGGKNLDGSEDLSIGGLYGVKVFPSGEVSAENGYILNAELLYSLPAYKGIGSQISVFADNAAVTAADDYADNGDTTLSDAGLGLYVNYNTFFVKAYYAFVVGGRQVESEPEYSDRLLVQAGMSF